MAWKAYGLLQRHHNCAYRLIPANATTIFTHFYSGLLRVGGHVIEILVLGR